MKNGYIVIKKNTDDTIDVLSGSEIRSKGRIFFNFDEANEAMKDYQLKYFYTFPLCSKEELYLFQVVPVEIPE